MSKVVDRCPSCGVEHDHRVHECEACGSAVRSWCRQHSREIGWLDGLACVRCEEEALPPPPPPAPVLSTPAPAPASSQAPGTVRFAPSGEERATLLTMLAVMVISMILCSAYTGRRASRTYGDVGDAVWVGLVFGWVLGLFLGGAVAGARVLLKRAIHRYRGRADV